MPRRQRRRKRSGGNAGLARMLKEIPPLVSVVLIAAARKTIGGWQEAGAMGRGDEKETVTATTKFPVVFISSNFLLAISQNFFLRGGVDVSLELTAFRLSGVGVAG